MSIDRQLAAKWDKHYEREDPYGAGGWWLSERKRIFNTYLAIPRNRAYQRALDLCSGEGHFTSLLAALVPSIVSVEVSRIAMERARKRLAGKDVQFLNTSAFEVDFPEDSFDLICAVECLCYAANRPEQVSKWARWLKPAGSVVVTGALLKGYFDWNEITGLIGREFDDLELVPVTSDLILSKAANRTFMPFRDGMYDLSMKITRCFPRSCTRHLAIIARSRKGTAVSGESPGDATRVP
jgi:SAM-dependent methyltransferase